MSVAEEMISVNLGEIQRELAGIRELMVKSLILDLTRVNPGNAPEKILAILNESVRKGKEPEFLYDG